MPLRVCLLVALLSSSALAGDWPQAAGPHGNFRVEGSAPVRWSGTHGTNVVWKTGLPQGGQSTVVVAGGRAFVTTHTPLTEMAGVAKDVVGHCLDARNGRVLWTCNLPGTRPMKMAGIFSDSTSPSPVSDGEHVWFFNASGSMGCWTVEGEEVWLREWTPRGRHHSRQHEPILQGDALLFVEVRDKELGGRIAMHRQPPAGVDVRDVWTYLHAIDKTTGDVLWAERTGTAIHNTPLVGRLADGTPAVVHGRGGGHGPLENPYGLSLTSLADEAPGKTLWSLELPRSSSYQNSHWDADLVYWIDGTDHVVVDTATGREVSRTNLTNGVTYRARTTDGGYETRTKYDVPVRRRTPHTNQSNIVVGDWHWFLAHDVHAVGRVHRTDGRVEYLEVPPGVVRQAGQPDREWGRGDRIRVTNVTGQEFATADKRSSGSGWGHVSAASPIAVGRHLLFPLMNGTCFVVDANAEVLDERALLAVNDLGPGLETWSLSSYSFADGSLFARTAKAVYRIGVTDKRP